MILTFCLCLKRLPADSTFTIEKWPFLNCFALLSLISLNHPNHCFLSFSLILIVFLRSDFRFWNFFEQCIFKDTRGIFYNSFRKLTVFGVSTVGRDSKWDKFPFCLMFFVWSDRFIARESDLTKWRIFFEIIRNALG